MKIIYEDNHLLVVLKPINIPVQEDDSKDLDMLTYLKKYLKEKHNKPGNVYLGLVHRLDRPVSGIMVFAKTSKAASRLSEQIRNHTFKKEYMAVLCGKTPKKDILVDKLLKNPKTNTTVVSEKGKEAILSYELIEYKNNYSLVKINLETGRSHQIRVQFSSRGYPLYGDQRYNKKALPKQQIALFANRLEFIHPVTKEKLFFEEELPNFEPWNIFKRWKSFFFVQI